MFSKTGSTLKAVTPNRLASEAKHFPYGETDGTPPADTKDYFATYRRDGTGLDYAWNRYYSPTMGRFTTADPGPYDYMKPERLNLYVYSGNNPVNLHDPNGRFWKELFGAIAGFFGGGQRDREPMLGGGGGNDVPEPDEGTVGAEETGGGGFGGNGGSSDDDDPQTEVTSAISFGAIACAVLPEGHVTGISGSVGFLGAPTGSVEILTNYNTGEISGFASGGLSAGVAGGASISVANTLVYGLGTNNSNYSGGFTGVTVSGPVTPIPGISVGVTGAASREGFSGINQASAQGSIAPLAPNLDRTFAIGTVVGASVYPPVNVTVTATTYSQPVSVGQLGPASALTQPFDYLMFILRQGCNP
jgi:RHS repeat-associated protein